MKRFSGGALTGLTAMAGAGALAPACAHDDSTIFVYDVLAPPQVAPGTACTFTNDVTQASIPYGVLDVGLSTTYTPTYLIGNQMIPQGNPATATTETSYVQIEGAVVTIKDAAGVQQLAQFTSLGSTTIPPSSGGIPSYSPLSVTTVDTSTLPSLPARVLTYVHFFGTTLGGQSVQSNEYEFPVNLCDGCLVTYGAFDISTLYCAPNCVGNPMLTSTVTTQPCVPGQDQLIDCSLCKSYAPVCNPTPVSTALCPISASTSGGLDASAE